MTVLAAAALLSTGKLPGTIYVESEFQVPGAFATCGPNSLAMAESYGLQSYVSTGVIYARMRAGTWRDPSDGRIHPRADPGGASKMGGLQAQAQADGFKVNRWDGKGDWKAWTIARLREDAPVLIEPSRGQVLRDFVTGQGMDATNLQYHFNLAVGYRAAWAWPEGFWMADGDNGATNPIVNGRRTRVVNGRNLQYYGADNLAASAPVALLAVYPKVTIGDGLPPMPPEYAPFLNDPEIKANGWRYGTYKGEPALIDGNGTPTYRGFAGWVAAHPQYFKGDYADNLAVGPEENRTQVEAWNTVHGDGAVQTYRRMRLVFSRPENRIYVMWIGSALVALERKTGVAA
jgi:hypothetical protein